MDSITHALLTRCRFLNLCSWQKWIQSASKSPSMQRQSAEGSELTACCLPRLRSSGLVGIAQVAMHRREHVVVIRSGRSGIVLHTMFYEGEIRREDEYRADTSQIPEKELELALLLVNSLKARFEPLKYRDNYRDKLDALIQAKLAGKVSEQGHAPRLAPVVNILEALQRSLAAMPCEPGPSDSTGNKPRRRQRAGRPQTGDRKRKVGRPSLSNPAVTNLASFDSCSLASD